jgi:3-oxoacyl-[acyl-carrier-protein] synthase III
MYILGMGKAHPSTVITNQFLADLDIGSDPEWIVSKIGIRERRSVLPLDYIKATKNSDPRAAEGLIEIDAVGLGVRSSEEALKNAGITADQIGMVLTNSCMPTQTVPPMGQVIANRLGVSPGAKVYDATSACPAFALHIDHLMNYEADKLPDYILCLASATLTQRVDYSNRSDSAIWGDGSAAFVVSPRHPGKLEILEACFEADPMRCEAVVVDTCGYFHQDGRAVRDFSVRQTVRLIKRLESEHLIDWSRDYFVGHQANATMLEQIRNNRNIPHEQHFSNVEYIGNQAGSGAGAVLAAHWKDIRPDRHVVVAVVGAGLSWGSVLMRSSGH